SRSKSSEPQREGPPARARARRPRRQRDSDGQPTALRAAERKLEQAARVREEAPRPWMQAREQTTRAADRDGDAPPGDRLCDVSPVRDQKLEPACTNADPQGLQPADDAPGRPDDDDQAEAGPHGGRGRTEGT